MPRSTRWRRALAGAILAALVGGCGASVDRIDVHDDRLPLDARRWVGDAEDAVTVAEAWLDDAEARLEAESRRREDVPRQGPPVLRDLRAMMDARVELADALVTRAEADRELAQAKLDLVNAETALRYDLAIYELQPLREAVDGARASVERAAIAVEDVRAKAHELTSRFWQAWKAHAAGGGDTRALWVPTERRAWHERE